MSQYSLEDRLRRSARRPPALRRRALQVPQRLVASGLEAASRLVVVSLLARPATLQTARRPQRAPAEWLPNRVGGRHLARHPLRLRQGVRTVRAGSWRGMVGKGAARLTATRWLAPFRRSALRPITRRGSAYLASSLRRLRPSRRTLCLLGYKRAAA